MGFTITQLLFSLVVLGLGYIVLYLANKPGNQLQKIGKIIGLAMVSLSALCIIFTLFIMFMILSHQPSGRNMRQPVQQGNAARPAQPPR
ncbi:MAG: hypothetical protein PHO70_03420 [Candidatus Omnitrophica bacterium]|nr:hypothetical protein [Candidatus Omnitrophota bacterium]